MHNGPPSPQQRRRRRALAEGPSWQRSTAGAALGTLGSRITGIARLVALAYALGVNAGADAYNLANTAPNILYDIMLGGIASSLFVPAFVEAIARQPGRRSERSISAIVTLSTIILIGSCIAFEFLAPGIIRLYTVLNHTSNAVRERQLATELLRFFIPQVALYGFFAIGEAILNVRGKFSLPAFAPVVNNVLSIGVFLAVAAISREQGLSYLVHHQVVVWILGAGTTGALVLQVIVLLPALRRSGIRIRAVWAPLDPGVRRLARLSSWVVGIVITNQVALFVVLLLADRLPGGAVSAYTYAYTVFQLPYAIVTFSVISVATPAIAAAWTAGRPARLRMLTGRGALAVIAFVVPAAVGMLLLAGPGMNLLLAHGATTLEGANRAGSALSLFAIGLPGFCIYLYLVRFLQTVGATRSAFYLYLLENGLNIALAVPLSMALGLGGLALALSCSYSVAAVAGFIVLARRVGSGHPLIPWRRVRHVALATAIMAACVVLTDRLLRLVIGRPVTWELLARVLVDIAVGVIAYLGTAVIASARRKRRRRGQGGLAPGYVRAGGISYPLDTPSRFPGWK